MTEEEAREWLTATLHVPRETVARLERFVDVLLSESQRQNLIASSTIESLWARHIVDSAQLLLHAPADGRWLDIGTGAGFPGLVVAMLGTHEVTLVESRTLRAAFLSHAVAALGLSNVTVCGASAESLRMPPYAIISARAVAPLDRLLATTAHHADTDSVWLLLKGRRAASELAAARKSWQGAFTMEPSITDPDAAIVVARNVARRGITRARR